MNILVTGGTGGLGSAIVRKLAADAENQVYFTYCNSEDVANAITEELCNTTAFRCNQRDDTDLNDLTKAINDWNLDVLVNNAWTGSPEGIRFHKLTLEQLSCDFTNNVLPTIAVTQAALETFRKKKNGKIITILTSSLIGVPPLGYGMYGSSKAYIAQMAKTWSKEYIKQGITSNCISPDFMQTGFTSGIDSRVVEQMAAEHPLKQIVQTENVAEVVAFLAYCTNYINGVNIPINAGINI